MGQQTIQVVFSPVEYTGKIFYHETLVYTDSSGDIFYLSARPQNQPPGSAVSNATSAASTVEIGQGSAGGTSSYGVLVAPKAVQLIPTQLALNDLFGEPDAPYSKETIAAGGDLSAEWAAMKDAFAAIDSAGFAYSPATQNSNSAASTAIVAAGLTPPSDTGPISGHWAPATGNILPITGVTPSDDEQANVTTDSNGETKLSWVVSNPNGATDNIQISQSKLGDVLTSYTEFGSGGIVSSGNWSQNLSSGQTVSQSISYNRSGQETLEQAQVDDASGTPEASVLAETDYGASPTTSFTVSTADGILQTFEQNGPAPSNLPSTLENIIDGPGASSALVPLELMNASEAPTPINLSLDGGSSLSLFEYASGALKVVGAVGAIVDIATSVSAAVTDLENGQNSAAAQVMTGLVSRLEVGSAGAEVGFEIGAFAGPWGALAGGLVGGLGGVALGNIATNALWADANSAITSIESAFGLNTAAGSAGSSALPSSLLPSATPSNIVSEVDQAVESAYITAEDSSSGQTLSQYIQLLQYNVKQNQAASYTANGSAGIADALIDNDGNTTVALYYPDSTLQVQTSEDSLGNVAVLNYTSGSVTSGETFLPTGLVSASDTDGTGTDQVQEIDNASGVATNVNLVDSANDTLIDGVSIGYGAGSSPTAVTVTDADGNAQSFDLTGTPTVQVAADGSATASGSGPSILIGGDGSTLNNGSANVLDVALGSNVTVNGGSGGAQADLLGSNETATLNDTTIDAGAGAFYFLQGNDNTLNLSANNDVAINSGTGNVVNNDNAGDAVTLSSNTATTINGSGGYFDVKGANVNVAASGESSNTDPNASYNLQGNDNTLNLGANTYLGITGGTGNVVNNDDAGDTVNLLSNTSTTINGSGGYFGVIGTLVSVAASGEYSDSGTGASYNLQGNDNTLTLGTDTYLGITGGTGNVVDHDDFGDTVNLLSNTSTTINGVNGYFGVIGTNVSVAASDENSDTGTGASYTLQGNDDTLSLGANTYLGITGGTGNLVKNDDASDTVNLLSNTSTTIDGSGGYFGVIGTNVNVTASGENSDTGTAASYYLQGSNNSLSLGENSSVEINSGTGNTVNNDVAGDTVNLGSNTSTTIDGTGGYFGVVGTNVSVTASGESSDTGTKDDYYLQGSNNSLTLGQDSSVEINSGTGNTVNNDVAGDVVNLGSNTSTTIDGTGGYFGVVGTNVSVTASGESSDTGTKDDYYLQGSNNSLTLGQDSSVEINSGTGNIVNNDVAGDVVNLGSNTSTTIDGSGGYFGVVGTGVTVTASGESSDTGTADSYSLQGSNNSLSLGQNSSVEINSGTGNTVNNVDLGNTVNLDSNTKATINGSGGTIGLDGTGIEADASNETINLKQIGDSANVYGSGDTANLFGSNETLGIYGGSNTIEDLHDAGDPFAFYDAASGAPVIWVGGDSTSNNDTIIANYNPKLVVTSGSSVNVNGNSDTVTGQGNGDTIGFTGGGEAVIVTNGAVNLNGNSDNVKVSGTGDAVNGNGASDYVYIEGGGDTANLSNGTVQLDANNVGVGIQGNSDNIDDGTKDQIHVNGSSDNVSGGSNDTLYITGQYDQDHDTYTPEIVYGTSIGDAVYSSTDQLQLLTAGSGNDTYTYNEFGEEVGSEEGGSEDFVQGVSQAQIENAPNVVLRTSAGSADAAALALNPVENGTLSAEESAGFVTAPQPVSTEAAWNSATITWAFAPASADGQDAVPFSGALGVQDQSVVEQAMQAWSNASGLNLTEASDPSQANIQIGWGEFDTASSGVLGYTNYTTDGNGHFTEAEIRMEDPSETSFVTDQNGQEEYSGTNAELYQVALHEIGHALGLADNSDPNSVMYYGSGASNLTLDATDIANIRSLYSQPAASMSEISSTVSTAANDATSLVAPSNSVPLPLQHAA